MEHGREHIYRRMHKKTSAGQTRPSQGWGGEGAGADEGRGKL